ncbi:glycosyl hydrolase family 67 [Leptospira perolatii]|uniref:Glycosyl hydrolase family 67 n=1 Tax=Leptospira perolatii TaxID=2023191 RepID=A0A2M9ZQK0_9LEPT|nr:glycosyl hydrolase family 67 [Leptospira perolatii]PJZ70520.1 glycosyl hydrolase family 67 [Leptospira perolatii]PJZ74356.1 glycosyl hydrolase family 67 [Leptospira perolatii]
MPTSSKTFLSIVDASGPFFLEKEEGTTNWSKAPIAKLEKGSKLSRKKHKKVRKSFQVYAKRVSDLGFNSISLDELCYLVAHPFYPELLKKKIHGYQKKYKKLFSIARKSGLNVFLTTDFLPLNESLRIQTDGKLPACRKVFAESLKQVFERFPDVQGVILRIGESDGVDVQKEFKSKLLIRKPEDARQLLLEILPIFEQYKKTLVFRTWTLGAYAIGDLIWNKSTYKKVFRGIKSKSLVVSMKYGEGDFFRYMELNPLFFEDGLPKLLELQARREYEGFGEFPSFVGWQYENYKNRLLANASSDLIGISVWTQTGGWSSFQNITFLKNSSFWNELNSLVSVRMFSKNWSVEKCIGKFWGKENLPKFLEFLRLSDQVIEHLLYDPEFARLTLYFHRVRIPPLIHITWDKVTVSEPFRLLTQTFVKDRNKSLELGKNALDSLLKMGELSKEIGIPFDFRFQYDTFQLILLCRKMMYENNPARYLELYEEAILLSSIYHDQYPKAYKFRFFPSGSKPKTWMKIVLRMFLRKKRSYRWVDLILFHPLLKKIYYYAYLKLRKKLPAFLNAQAMPISELLC